jgi:hypothetical protein
MVLGLTMAEIMLLLIFLLLLILAARLISEQKAARLAADARDRAVAAQHEAEEKLATLQPLLDEIRRSNPTVYDITKEYTKVKQEAEAAKKQVEEAKSAMELLEEVRKAHPEMSKEEAARELERLADVGRKIQEQATELMPSAEPEEAIKHLQMAATVGDQAMKSGKTPEDLVPSAQRCQKDLAVCKAGNSDLTQKLAQKGGTLPPCWYDALTGDTQYIFTTYLRDDGIYLKNNRVPGREVDQAALPISSFEFGRAYSAWEFTKAGRDIRQYSAKQDPECRFYVLVYDETGNDKQRYVELKEKGVEQIFYIKKVTR